MRFIVYILFLILAVLTACKDPEIKKKSPIGDINKGVFILNEGNFKSGNATLDFYDIETNKLNEDIFETSNGFKLGDVLQFATIIGNKIYLIVNNSGKIYVCDINTLKVINTITDCPSPRFLTACATNKAYISDFKSGEIYVLDLTANKITSKINSPTWTEEMIMVGSKLYFSKPRKEYIYILNTNTDEIEDSIKTYIGGTKLLLDKNNLLFQLSEGDLYSGLPNADRGAITAIDVDHQNNIQQYIFSRGSAIDFALSQNKDSLYYLYGSLYKTATESLTFNQNKMIDGSGKQYYSISINDINGDLILSNALDYVSNSNIEYYDKSLKLIHQFNAGIISGGFLFKNQ